MKKSQNLFYNFPIRQSMSPESRFSLCFHVRGHLSPDHLPGLWLTSTSRNVFLLSLVTLTTTWFQLHLIFPWPAGSDSWPHGHVQLVLPWDLTTSSCLAMQPWLPASLGSLAFFTSLSPLQPRSADLAHRNRVQEPHQQGWENAGSCEEVLFSFWHLTSNVVELTHSDASEHTGSGTEVTVQPISPAVSKDRREGSPDEGHPIP